MKRSDKLDLISALIKSNVPPIIGFDIMKMSVINKLSINADNVTIK